MLNKCSIFVEFKNKNSFCVKFISVIKMKEDYVENVFNEMLEDIKYIKIATFLLREEK